MPREIDHYMKYPHSRAEIVGLEKNTMQMLYHKNALSVDF